MNANNNSNVSNSVSNATAVTDTDVLQHMKGLKFHTVMLFKNKDGKIIDALTIDNSFTKDRLNEYREQYQYGNKIPDNLSAPQTFSEWWDQLDVKQYFKDQMEKDYLMSLYLKNPDPSSDLDVKHYTISVNTDSDVTDFLDFLNDLRKKLGVKMQGGSQLEDAMKSKREEYEKQIENNKKMQSLYDIYGQLPVVKEIFGKAAIQELQKTMSPKEMENKLKELDLELDTIVKSNTTPQLQQPQPKRLTYDAILAILKNPTTYNELFTP